MIADKAARIAMVKRLEAALMTIAEVCDTDPAALPIFERIERELVAAQAEIESDPIARARARLRLTS
ncbi:hypothetical protein BMI86_10115 [Thioclava sp. DLFJ5-1]|uniref:hypothetical protein n=1 Tax=Thioclava sp. DLFJ5-1 TaxID=1915314 RepID=UPI00099844C3|nr:hypothetical protein [Thioclava sp. DLFJ5-1]OOY20852.1 hypothetical protein BMI86_10115 [Thioclava sp. DLFJ5-1]